MKKLRFICALVALATVLTTISLFPSFSATALASSGKFSGGTGTQNDPYLISNAAEVIYFRDFVNTVNTGKQKYYFELTADVDMEGYTWSTAIGITGHHFKSQLDGKGHTISNLVLTSQGFFGFVNGLSDSEPAVVKNLTLSNVTASFSSSNSGIFIYRPHANSGSVVFENCHVKSSVINTTATKVGGFAGFFDTLGTNHSYSFTNCSTEVTVNTSKSQVGGFVGYNSVPATYKNCSSSATVIPSGSIKNIGGFEPINQTNNTYINCTSALTLISNNVTNNVGAFFGSSTAAITLNACTAVSNINTSASEVGGFIGSATAVTIFENCISKGNITSTSSNVGGYVGSLNVAEPATVNDPDDYTIFRGSANLTTITALKDAAGFAASINDSYVKFIRCYNAGPITATSTDKSNVYIAHLVASATKDAYSKSRVKFSRNYIISDVPLTGGRIYANKVENNIPSTAISNYCIIAYGGSDRPFALMADYYGLNYDKYDVVKKSELFLLAADGKVTSFRGLGDVVTLGRQEANERNEDGTYDLRLVGAVCDLTKISGFKITISDGTKAATHNIEVSKAYRSLIAGGELITAPEGYYFITLVIEDFDDNGYAIDFSAYNEETTDFKTSIAGVHYVGAYDVGDGHTMDLYRGVTKEAYLKICESIAKSGYSLYSANTSSSNIFNTYYDQKTGYMKHAYWIEYSREMRIVTAKTSNLPITSNSGNNSLYDSVMVHQITALTSDKSDGGLGFIIRLNDGRFIIIDGGNYSSSYKDNATEIYNFLKKNAKDPDNIVIAAWILTHGHSDHTEAFVGFANTYYKDKTIKLESILFNPCETAEQTKFTTFSTSAVYSAISERYPSVPVYKPLSGQKYTFSNTTIEILYTMSDFLPNVIVNEGDGESTATKKGNGNVQTMVFMIDLVANDGKNNNFLVLGDTTTDACNEMSARYGSYLSSKYVQASHHGLAIGANANLYFRRNNATIELYELADPDIVFWTTSAAKFEERSVREVNNYLINTLKPQNITASDDISTRTIYVK